MTVDGLPAVCASVKCDYELVEPSSTAESMTVSGLEVTITGTGLPTGEEIESITLSKTECEVSASSEAQITCTLQASWVHGDWTPEIRDLKGLSSLTSGFSAH